MHWADKTAEDLTRRGKSHVIETGTSISGIPHIGNASDVIRGDAIRKALADKGINARFIWVADDSDPFRKVPRGFEKLKDYLGFPVHDLPDPEGCHANFVDHFVEPFIADLSEFGAAPEVISGREMYKNGEFYGGIKTALDNCEKIVEILNGFRQEPLPGDFIPWNPVCEKCGRISTTKPLSRVGDIVRYVCERTEVSGGTVEGCGFEGESDIKKGGGKLPWRVEWAMRWAHFGVTCEPLGKEHASAGGSFWTSKIVCKDVFGWEPPMPVIYEFFTLNGEKISSSKGNVITLSDWLEIAEPEVLKAFMYKVLKKQRDIDLGRVSNLVDEYDELEAMYFAGSDEDSKRHYELSQVSGPKKLQVPFTMCAVMSQIPNLDLEEAAKRLGNQGYEDFDLGRLDKRTRLAGNWVRRFGPDYLRFELLQDVSGICLDEKQKEGLSILAGELDKKYKPAELHKKIYETARSIGLEPNSLFDSIYLSLIGKTKGPRAGYFLLALDKNFVQKRFGDV
ncbi:MAG: lysine--tRNA ligase [Candidatus Altiarchaeales archaeon IMC4]|nr:MAG: lysine--tRNA ligase [Candidatus Altiarchaeales archaeon IMC4]